ncbi:hypothetical protein KI387_002461 [Taxus chinensis]|uniref:Tetratricopeptide repeat-like superfamily protein n=1 Tax=Taxus chinensis TaxID=29808 RepID=A0AA38GWC0_TAXCH|nr:hypothetical protein KI387_002461 [Taxus chinensis]
MLVDGVGVVQSSHMVVCLPTCVRIPLKEGSSLRSAQSLLILLYSCVVDTSKRYLGALKFRQFSRLRKNFPYAMTMLLRSSSTPILGSMIPHADNHKENIGKANPFSENGNRFCFHSTNSHAHLHSSYDTCSVDDEKEANYSSNFRRVQSEGNLESMLSRGSPVQAKIASETILQCDSFDDFNLTSLNKPWHRRMSASKRLPSLKSISSLSCYCNGKEEVKEEINQDEILENFADALESSMQEFSFGNENVMESSLNGFAISGNNQQGFAISGNNQQGMVSAEQMFMARGLGIDVMEPATDIGGGRGSSTSKRISTGGGGGGGDGYGAGSENIEEYYQRMLENNPSNSLILCNYAKFLYETKRDYPKAEEYYSRAILAQPDDGEVLAQYAKLIWDFHGDEERASVYFEQAVQASPADCNVLAAYASFLWNTDGDKGEQEEEKYQERSNFSGSLNAYGSATATMA